MKQEEEEEEEEVGRVGGGWDRTIGEEDSVSLPSPSIP
jgi:hypothetical protein